ncbi:sorting nexin-15-like [Xyrauchen texanus]|uniref:sorting nexin-15-like n=1 Tax=Xyrauchen texanus TaxID=154827 RepID=UPI002241AB98|nr:sorting nexin-15-like [Xyrauchen texanus]
MEHKSSGQKCINLCPRLGQCLHQTQRWVDWQVVLWKRYSELKKVHGHFDEAVIEERRKAAEAMLLFTTNIPALYNSPQLKDFFRNVQAALSCNGDWCCQAPEMQKSNIRVVQTRVGHAQKNVTKWKQPVSTYISSPTSYYASLENHGCLLDQSEEFDLLFDSELEEHADKAPPSLSDTDLAIFDPCAKEEQPHGSPSHAELLSVPLTTPTLLNGANVELNVAQEREREADFSAAVDILMKGVHGDVDLKRRDAVKRKIAEVLEHAEIFLSIQTPTHNHNT